MSDDEPKEEESIETALKGLAPATPNIPRDRLMFRAGQASLRKTSRQLSLLTAFVGVLVGVGGSYCALRAALQPEVQIQYVQVPVLVPTPAAPTQPSKNLETPAPPAPSPSDLAGAPAWDFLGIFPEPTAGYLHLRDQVLRWGVEILPTGAAGTEEKQTQSPPSNLLKIQAQLLEKMPGF